MVCLPRGGTYLTGDLKGEFCMEPEVTLLPERLFALLPRGFWATRGMIAGCRRRRECGGRRDGSIDVNRSVALGVKSNTTSG